MNKTLLLTLALGLALLSMVLIMMTIGNKRINRDSNLPVSQESGKQITSAYFDIDDSNLSQQGTFTATVSLERNEEDPAPAAFEIHVNYDPNKVAVTDVSVGNIWTGSNVLEEEIDNNAGLVKFSAGQGFDAEVDGNGMLVINFEVLETDGQIDLSLGGESQVAYVGHREEVLLTAEPVMISPN